MRAIRTASRDAGANDGHVGPRASADHRRATRAVPAPRVDRHDDGCPSAAPCDHDDDRRDVAAAAPAMSGSDASRSDAFVFFGATGDLAFKQIFPALQALIRTGRLDMPIVGIGRKELGVEALRARAKESLAKADGVDAVAFAKLSKQLRYVAVDYDDPSTFERIREAIGGSKRPLHYVALPPEVFEKVAANLAKAGLAKDARLALEKPFGRDAASAKALSKALHAFFPEEAILRVDHFLGKEAVENIVYFRAANPLLEASLRRDHVESVEITMAETFGVKGRAEFYDRVGAVRDVVQNHLLEVIACLAMELPEERGHAALRAARSRLLAQVATLDPANIVRGQVRGYKDEKGVAKDSTTETFAAVRFAIDSPRWSGVPFFVRAGKSLPVTATEAVVRWKRASHPVLEDEAPPAPNYVRFRIGPESVIALGANVKTDGEAMAGEARELVLRQASPDAMAAYERLLGDAIDGDPTLFARQDAVEESWRVVGPVLGGATPVSTYEPGSWGPAEAARITPEGGWLDPS
jgi:glucose-6-phosphate 1-dehydrogenase